MTDLLTTWILDVPASQLGDPPLPAPRRIRLHANDLDAHTLSGDGDTLEMTVDGRRLVYRRVLDPVKQVILYRRDLNMRKGKIAAQVAHASLAVLLRRDEGSWGRLSVPLDPAMASWIARGTAKVVLSVESEADLLRAYEEARARGLPAELVTDAGRTEFKGVPTRTTCAIGPARAADIDAITGPEGLVPTKLA